MHTGGGIAHSLMSGVHDVFRAIVPHPSDRIPLTWSVSWIPVVCYFPFVYLAYLARRPDTYLARLLLLPVIVTLILVAAYRFTWVQPELNVYNWGQCLFAATAIAKALEYGLNPEGMLKVGESRPGVVKGKAKSPGAGHSTSNGDASHKPEAHNGIYDALELAYTLRGLKWKFGQGMYIPPFERPLERSAFLRATFVSLAKNFILLDLLDSLVKLFPGVGTPVGGSMFYSDLSPIARYTVATVIHILTGAAILSGFHMVYDLITFVAVTLFGSSPRSWPPVMDNPWISQSMHEFWSKRWHQVLRQTFLVFGGYPGKWIAGKVGMVFGAFIASGLFHECAMYSMGRGYDHSATLFFGSQGLVLLLERIWKKVTGRPVGGWPGRLWVYFIMFVAAQPMTNAWHRRGLGGNMVIPPFISPFRLYILPFAQRLIESLH
ncbi:hypothetical protein FA15DRAFT_665836 [Coprinopsis marcescibilis]|uniref:Wax synthase domain-containing protein n=1 Tax=Coprinopsis marcescibilis TaxID=230819 RepID=A0A5C3L5I3_COPMA|nr:hypothetical protein FA15DRAFT_665836 [Coprinopsis marcescibilis]